MLDIHRLLDATVKVAYQAGERILTVYNEDFHVEQKADNTPLTAADMAAHRAIVDGLTSLTPDIPILSEESEHISFAERQSWNEYWLVDPLDGTREFIKRNEEFTVNIALVRGHEAVLGVIYAPVLGKIYYAAKGKGSYKRVALNKAQAIHVQATRRDKLIVAGSRSHHSREFKKFIEHFPAHEQINMGSALKSCLVAEGKIDIYPRLGPTSEWDTAAAQCIVEEAGGMLTDTSMQRLQYNTKSELLNPHFFVFGDVSVDWSQYL